VRRVRINFRVFCSLKIGGDKVSTVVYEICGACLGLKVTELKRLSKYNCR